MDVRLEMMKYLTKEEFNFMLSMPILCNFKHEKPLSTSWKIGTCFPWKIF